MRVAVSVFVGMAMIHGALQAAEVSIAEDRMAVVDGQRTFILGLYENPKEDADLKDVKTAGFNLVQSTADAAALDRLDAEGLHAWINTGGAIDLSVQREEREARLRGMVEELGAHPALAIWEVPDEALWNNWHNATLWRRQAEPQQLREAMAKHEDAAAVARVQAQMDAAHALNLLGNYREAERLMDEAWGFLGLESPRPGFGLGDAAARAATMQQGMLAGYRLLREIDPEHPVWMNHAPRNQIAQLAAYNEAADIVGCDIYPQPGFPYVGHSDVADQTLSAVGVYTDRMQAAAPGKPVWMVLQGFGWADLQEDPTEEEIARKRRPTIEETRFMAYDAIAHGARGILYWGSYRVEKDSQFWKELLQVVRELSERQPVLSAPDATLSLEIGYEETYGSIERDPIVLPKAAPDGTWLLVVNENPDPLHVSIGGLGSGTAAYVDSYAPEKQYQVEAGELAVYVPRRAFVLLAPQ